MARRRGGSPSAEWVKLMCSSGGRFALRLGDGALRHIGGQTRLISVPRAASFGELLRRVEAADTAADVGSLVVKYQLPGEDLDSLVSVSGPEDYENMMEEYDKLAAAAPGGSAKLRVFLFRATTAGRSTDSCSGSGSNNHAINCVSAEIIRRKSSTVSSARGSELASEFSMVPPPPSRPFECLHSGGAHRHIAFSKPVSRSAVPVTAPAMGIPPPALQPHNQGAILASYATTLQPQLATFVPPEQPKVSSYLQQMPSYHCRFCACANEPVCDSAFLLSTAQQMPLSTISSGNKSSRSLHVRIVNFAPVDHCT